ncbi:hypothetical protein KDA23_04280 [Candidatus Saccharibacteria bacterium]|nr:hypothetical protein [Candidatus Saccharibacteria bacterium]
MDSIYDLLSNRDFDEPPEIGALKQYIRDNYQSEAGITMRERDIVITVQSAALVSRLRFDMRKMVDTTKVTKKIVLRIG